jgi:hypothetical protein
MASKATKKPLGSLTDVVASEKARNLVAKIVGGAFATIIAPILVTYLIKSMEQKGETPKPPAAAAPAATVPPEVVATHATTQPTVHATSRENLSSQPWNTPAFEQWMHATQALNAKQQLEVVSRKLKELNPGFDGQLTSGDGRGSRKIENGVVALLKVEVGKVSDLSPVRALVHLRQLTCTGKSANHSKFSNLSPLAGMALTRADFSYTDVSDLRPLIGMPLEELRFESAKVADLSPLSKMPLTNLVCFGNPISDLSPLLDCKGLTRLDCRQTKVTAAQVAALQKTLPNCKIEWDGAPSASPPGEDAKPKTSEPAASGTK